MSRDHALQGRQRHSMLHLVHSRTAWALAARQNTWNSASLQARSVTASVEAVACGVCLFTYCLCQLCWRGQPAHTRLAQEALCDALQLAPAVL